MFRLFRGFVAEGLGLGGLIWAMSMLSGSSSLPTIEARPSRNSSVVVTLQKPPIFASLEPPEVESPAFEPPTFDAPAFEAPTLKAERSTFFRGTDSLFER
jgi:hypothetical protein